MTNRNHLFAEIDFVLIDKSTCLFGITRIMTPLRMYSGTSDPILSTYSPTLNLGIRVVLQPTLRKTAHLGPSSGTPSRSPVGMRDHSVVSLLLANRQDLSCCECSFVSAFWTFDLQSHLRVTFIGCSHGFQMHTTFAFPQAYV
jgi:hypothetical protein